MKCMHLMAAIVAGLLAAGPSLAEKPGHAGGKGKHKQESREDAGKPAQVFADGQRKVVHEYYDEQMRYGRCPPGLAKKNNGCMPPGQAKKWSMGRPLARDVVFYEVPPALIAQIGRPPAQHRYVRVGTDLLLIALGTGIVVDAIRDLGRI
jgi:Ni/Co efflux regulator RcnB